MSKLVVLHQPAPPRRSTINPHPASPSGASPSAATESRQPALDPTRKMVGNRPTTVREKELHVRLYLKPAFGPLRLDAIRGEARRERAPLNRETAFGGSVAACSG